MSEATNSRETFVAAHVAAIKLGVPAAWLRDEAEAGRIPCLPVKRRILFNVEAVERVLLQRAVEKREVAHA